MKDEENVDQDLLDISWKSKVNLFKLAAMAGIAFELGRWLVDLILPNVK